MTRSSEQERERRRAFTELHARLAPDLLRYLERRTDSPEDAADLLAETFLTAWVKFRRVPREAEAARMWMFVTARNVSNNTRRSRRRRHALADRLRDEIATAAPIRESPPAPVIDARRAVTALAADLQELVVLIHWVGFTLPEAARIIGIRESTARGRYQRARQRLQTELIQYAPHPTPASTASPPTEQATLDE